MLRRLKGLRQSEGINISHGNSDSAPLCIKLVASDEAKDVYSQLSESTRLIRLLDVCPGSWDQPLRGTLRVVHIEAAPSYEALSYTWGTPPPQRESTATQFDYYSITPNLYRALRRLRRTSQVRTLWVDAVCINQADTAERASQVSIMGEIYGQASNVLIWLGEYPGAMAEDTVRTKTPHWDEPWFPWTKQKSTRLNARGALFMEFLEKALQDADPKWHDRAWVIQEYVLSRKATLCFGPVSMPFDKVRFGDMTLGLPELREHILEFHSKISDMHRLKTDRAAQRSSVHEAAFYTCRASCAKLQDKVYSVLSLIDAKEASMIPIDYDMSPGELYARATFASIAVQQDFVILELVAFDEEPSMPGLPSWAADFNRKREPYHEQLHAYLFPGSRMDWTSRNRLPLTGPCLSGDGRLLSMRGSQVGCVKKIVPLDLSMDAKLDRPMREFAASMVGLLSEVSWNVDMNPVAAIWKDLTTSGVLVDAMSQSGFDLTFARVLESSFAVWDDVKRLANHTSITPQPKFWESNAQERIARRATVDGGRQLYDFCNDCGHGVTAYVSSNGMLGFGIASIEPGDHIVVIVNCALPVILRPSGSHFTFKGFTWVHGVGGSDGLLWTANEKTFVLC